MTDEPGRVSDAEAEAARESQAGDIAANPPSAAGRDDGPQQRGDGERDHRLPRHRRAPRRRDDGRPGLLPRLGRVLPRQLAAHDRLHPGHRRRPQRRVHPAARATDEGGRRRRPGLRRPAAHPRGHAAARAVDRGGDRGTVDRRPLHAERLPAERVRPRGRLRPAVPAADLLLRPVRDAQPGPELPRPLRGPDVRADRQQHRGHRDLRPVHRDRRNVGRGGRRPLDRPGAHPRHRHDAGRRPPGPHPAAGHVAQRLRLAAALRLARGGPGQGRARWRPGRSGWSSSTRSPTSSSPGWPRRRTSTRARPTRWRPA